MKLRSRDGRPSSAWTKKMLRVHTLSLKIAGLTGGAVVAVALVMVILFGTEWLIPGTVLALAAFLATYAGAVLLTRKRLELARATLKQARKNDFGALQQSDFPKGDELNDLVRQVYRTGRVLQSEMTQLRRIAHYRRSFIGDVSHELKTPIFSIKGYAETLLGGALDDPSVRQTFVRKILKNADRLHNLTADLSEISRLESGELQMSFEPFHVGDLIPEIVESLEPAAANRNISLSTDAAEDLPLVLGDAQRIRQVIVNLIDNAIKYTDPNGHVEIRIAIGHDESVDVEVIDSGIGIPKKLIPRITERFYRVDQSRSRSAGGTGLGLAIVKHILAAHDQKLRVKSTPGEGSSFRFSLPVVTATPASER